MPSKLIAPISPLKLLKVDIINMNTDSSSAIILTARVKMHQTLVRMISTYLSLYICSEKGKVLPKNNQNKFHSFMHTVMTGNKTDFDGY